MSKRKLISFDWALKKLLRSKANFGILSIELIVKITGLSADEITGL